VGHFPSVIKRDGKLFPGRLHTIILTTYPLKRNYRQIGRLNVDTNLSDVSINIMNLLTDEGVKFVSLLRDNLVEGRSWEMAASRALLNKGGVYSGTLLAYENERMYYGSVPGITIKRIINENTITNEEVAYDSLSR